jgi:hypothetical protein
VIIVSLPFQPEKKQEKKQQKKQLCLSTFQSCSDTNKKSKKKKRSGEGVPLKQHSGKQGFCEIGACVSVSRRLFGMGGGMNSLFFFEVGHAKAHLLLNSVEGGGGQQKAFF